MSLNELHYTSALHNVIRPYYLISRYLPNNNFAKLLTYILIHILIIGI